MIDICMATYNGERFLREQINSILTQTYSNWHLYIRDDGSTDKTVEIFNKYYLSYPEKITIISDNLGNLGFIQNFNEILKYTTSEFIAFCDQDDIWLNEKLQMLFFTIKSCKNENRLVYSNFSFINQKGELILSDFYNKRKNSIFLKYNSVFDKSIFYRSLPGCSMMINRSLLDCSCTISKQFKLGHDVWFHLIALMFGEVVYINENLIYRRVHEDNVSGTKNKCLNYYIKKLINFEVKDISHNIEVAILLNKIFRDSVNEGVKQDMKDIIELNNSCVFSRINYFMKKGFFELFFLDLAVLFIRFCKPIKIKKSANE